MSRLPGTPKTGGRVKGTPNKHQADVRQMMIDALNAAGGVEYLRQRALDQPVAFLGLIGKVLPLQVSGPNGGAIAVDFRWADATPADVVTAVVAETIEADADTLIEWKPPELAND